MAVPAATSFSVRGRWNGRSYQVIRSLGAGANGKVYLALENDRKYALKMSTDATGIALEYRLLQHLQSKLRQGGRNAVQGYRLGPFVSDLDDMLTANGERIFFYAMEYIAGVPASVYIREKGESAVRHVALQLLEFLENLHQLGYAFGDLKAENVLVNPITGEVRPVDFGGATRFGEGIRQYTEWYDRAHWSLGNRRADPGYDLFAAAMLIVRLLVPEAKDIAGGKNGLMKIRRMLSRHPVRRAWLPLLEKAWRGGFRNASEMRLALLRINNAERAGRGLKIAAELFKKVDRELSRDWDWTDWTAIASGVLCMSMILRWFMVK